MQEFYVALGGKNLGEIRSLRKYAWTDFRKTFLSEFNESDVTMAEFTMLDREHKAKIKNSAGWFVGGVFTRNEHGKLWRSRNTLRGRSMIVLDIDHLAEFDYSVEDVTDALRLLNVTFAVYSTPSSITRDIRLRIVVPIDAGMKPEHYQPIGRWLAGQIGIEIFDHTGFEEARLMYLPVCLADGPKVAEYHDGVALSRNDVLNSYADWRDFGSWPSSEHEGGARKANTKAEDPTQKRGAIGAFCRVFNVHEAISRWLTDFFIQHDESTYMPTDATGVPGARVYDDELFLYNNHESGPTSKRNLNAFDLVRICLFEEELDVLVDDDLPITKYPSFKAMMDFALQQPEVQSELNEGEFDDVPEGFDPRTYNGALHSFDVLAHAISNLPSQSSNRAETGTKLTRIANAKFTPTDERALLRALQTKYDIRPTTKDLEQELKDVRAAVGTQDETGEVHDLELELISEFETEYYPDNTIKRIGKVYWTFAEGLWSMRNEEIIAGQFAQTVIRLRKERPDDAREIAAMVGETKTSALASSLHRMMANLIAERDTDEDPLKLLRRFDLPVINFRNGELHFNARGGHKFTEHNPAHFFTTRIDTVYDPLAECPIFDEFLEHCFANADDPMGLIQFAEELMGYTVNNSRWRKIWVMCFGETDTGKTTFAEVLTSLLGGASVEKKLISLSSVRGGEFKDAGLIGKLLFLDDDMDKGAMLPDGDIKRISEEKAIQTAIKYGDDLRFICRAFPMICTNHWPRTQDITDAFVKRTLVLPFHNPYKYGVDASDQTKYKMLKDERPGILNRCIEGLVRLRRRGSFALPIDSLRAREEWLRHANPVSGFIASCLIETEDAMIAPKDLHERYIEWHYEEYGGTGIKVLPKQEFYRRCDAKLGGRSHYDTHGNQMYRGWSVRSIATPVQREFAEVPDTFGDDMDDLLGD